MIDFREEVIIACLVSPKWRKTFMSSEISSSNFESTVHKWVWDKLLPVSGDDEITLTIAEELICKDPTISKNESLLEASLENLVSIFRKIKKRISKGESPIYPNISKNFITHVIRKTLIAESIRNIVSKIDESSQPEDVYQAFESEFNKIRQTFNQSDNYEISNPIENLEQRLERQRKSFESGKRLQFKFNHLNYFFPLGISESEMLLICGDTNVGKSILTENLLEMAFGQFNKLNTIYFYTENEQAQSEARFDAMVNEVSYDSVYSGEVDNVALKKMLEKYSEYGNNEKYGKIIFVKLVPGRFTINTISDIISSLEIEHGIEFKFIVCDSPEHQLPSVNHKEFFRGKAQVYFDWKTFTAHTRKIVATTVQRKVDPGSLHKKKERKEEADIASPAPEEAAGSVEIPRIVDWMVVVTRGRGIDKMLGRSKIWLVKARNSAIPERPLYMFISKDNLRVSFTHWEPPSEDESNEEDVKDNKQNKASNGFKAKFKITKDGIRDGEDE